MSPNEHKLAYLIHGEDEALVGQRLTELLAELAQHEGFGTESVEEHREGAPNEGVMLGPVLDACQTTPFLSAGRLVVLKDAQTLNAEQIAELAEYLRAPLESTILIITYVAPRPRRAPAALTKAVSAVGEILAAQPETRERSSWIAEHVRAASLKLDADAANELQGHLGEDLSRLEGILETLESTYGPGASIGRAELEPFLGEAGSVAPWDLTDAIDAGDVAKATTALHRLLEAGERHPLALLSGLHRHYAAMLALDGSGANTDAQASQITGLSPYPARKALAQSRRLGHDRIARAIGLLATADLDLRGQSGLSSEIVLEILVARLAQDARTTSGSAARSRRPSTARS